MGFSSSAIEKNRNLINDAHVIQPIVSLQAKSARSAMRIRVFEGKKRRLQLGLALFIGVLATLYAASSSRAQKTTTPDQSARRALIEESCSACHNQKSRTGGVSLEGLNF